MSHTPTLELAMKKAVEVGLVQKYAEPEKYLEVWDGMEQVLNCVYDRLTAENERLRGALKRLIECLPDGNPVYSAKLAPVLNQAKQALGG